MKKLKKAVLTTTASLLLLPGSTMVASERLEQALALSPEEEVKEIQQAEQPEPEEPKQRRWVCKGCTEVEQKVLDAFQDRGIKDKVALGVLMGNVKHESQFKTTICEGGKLTGYKGCWRGGFGLIQWTTVGRYDGLGRTARAYQLDPNSLDAQLKWLFSEREWLAVEAKFKTEGQSFQYYMNAAYRWLGWGIFGSRGRYAQKYIGYLHYE